MLFFKKRSQDDTIPTEEEIKLLVDFAVSKQPLLIGFSVMSIFRDVTVSLITALREKLDTPIIIGGVHAIINPEDCLQMADICCLGEGEKPIEMILEQLKKGDLKTDIPNCLFKKNGNTIKNKMSYICTELDDLPFPDLTGKNKYFIENNKLKNQDPYLTFIEQSKKYDFKAYRGCPYRCTYCGNDAIRNAYGDKKKYLRRRSVKNVISELKNALLQFPDLEYICSYDEVFMSDNKYVNEFVKEYIEHINLPLSCDTYITTADENIVTDMARAGLKHVTVGIEAFSEKIRKEIYKRFQSDDLLLEKIYLFNKYQVHLAYDFILDNPYETANDMEKFFFSFILKLPRPCRFNLFSLCHLPGSELTERLLKEGRISENDIIGSSNKGLHQWKATATGERNPEITFWVNMMYLFSHRIECRKKVYHLPFFLVHLIARLKSPLILRFTQLVLGFVSTICKK